MLNKDKHLFINDGWLDAKNSPLVLTTTSVAFYPCRQLCSAFCACHLCILTIVQACCLPVSIPACKIFPPLVVSRMRTSVYARFPHVFSRPVVSSMLSSILNPVLSFFFESTEQENHCRELFPSSPSLLSRTAFKSGHTQTIHVSNHEGRRRL